MPSARPQLDDCPEMPACQPVCPRADEAPGDRHSCGPSAIVNGEARSLRGEPASTSLLDWLRREGLTGVKEGCGEGECGACAVLILRSEPAGPRRSAWRAINSCLTPAVACVGAELITVEGCGSEESPHPAQRAMAAAGGSQCGYCTPGFVVSMVAEQQRAAALGQPFNVHALAGNLCRCTGYRPICMAASSLEAPAEDDRLWQRTEHAARTQPAGPVLFTPAPTASTHSAFARPSDLSEAHALLRQYPQARLLAGSTDVGVEISIHGERPDLLVAIDHLEALREFTRTENELIIGAAVTLREIETRLGGTVPLLAELLPQFASPLIRNAATLGGNLATASPVGDCAPALIALAARLRLSRPEGTREVAVEDFFTSYRKTVLRPGELIESAIIPLPAAPVSAFTKIAKRRLDDISSIAAAVALSLSDPDPRGQVRVVDARIGLGGVAATPLRARATEAALIGAPWDLDGLAAAASALGNEGTPLDDHRASAAYRSAMLGNILPALWERTSAGGAA